MMTLMRQIIKTASVVYRLRRLTSTTVRVPVGSNESIIKLVVVEKHVYSRTVVSLRYHYKNPTKRGNRNYWAILTTLPLSVAIVTTRPFSLPYN
jgi:hypothetical protein